MIDERLKVAITVATASASVEIPPGNVDRVELTMTPYGCEATLAFWLKDGVALGGSVADELLTDFIAAGLLKVTLAISSIYLRESMETPPDPLTVKGIVVSRAVTLEPEARTSGDSSALRIGVPTMIRRYELRMVDPAAALWDQHRPCALYVQKTVMDVVNEHKGSHITITGDTPFLTVSHDVLTLGVGAALNGATFYDWLLGLVAQHDSQLLYDAKLSSYKLVDTKPATGTPGALPPQAVRTVRAILPEPPRHDVHVLNGSTLDVKNEAVTSANTAGIRHDLLLRSPIAATITDRKTLETRRNRVPKQVLELDLNAWPAVAAQPGALVSLDLTAWGTTGLAAATSCRVTAFKLSLRGPQVAESERAASALMAGTLTLTVEASDDATPRLPKVRPAQAPIEVEGLVVSTVGEEAQLTWEVTTHSETSIDQVKVKVPLWADQEVVVDLHPDAFSGHTWRPLYKGQRVLLRLKAFEAEILRCLDWRPGARQTAATQGDAVMLGKTETDRTLLTHIYTDDKPVFEINRKNDKDIAFIKIEEGVLTIKVHEES
ncbi:MAG: hypothetical protein IPI35_16425 [Deltaproteobacteria bacterium]|nr:hypothetical protein [Deltaproteobacteria bacterium]